MSLIKNKKAAFNYEIREKIEAGISLFGFEVKSIRAGNGSLSGSFVKIKESGAYLTGAYIAAYQPANTPDTYDPYRDRKLLLTKKELKFLIGKQQEQGLTLIPLSLYNKGKLIKLELALARGKKKHDKRETIKQRDVEREVKREFKERLR